MKNNTGYQLLLLQITNIISTQLICRGSGEINTFGLYVSVLPINKYVMVEKNIVTLVDDKTTTQKKSNLWLQQ